MGYNMDDAFPSKGISASDLQGKTVTVVIEKIEYKQYQNGDGGFVMYFVGKKKPLSINKTKNGVLKAAFGSNSDAWIGQTINIAPGQTLYMGNQVDCVNVSVPPPGSAVAGTPSAEPSPPAEPAPPMDPRLAATQGGLAAASGIDEDEVPF